MQEVFKKIIENLEKKKDYFQRFYECEGKTEHDSDLNKATQLAFDDAIEIVKQAAAEYNNGWIPCSERLPEEHDSIFAKLKGTDKWKRTMFEKTSDIVNVIISDNKGNVVTTYANTIDGKWSCDLLKCYKEYRIIAWQPLPDPYHSKGERKA